jgi:hypothetical protein
MQVRLGEIAYARSGDKGSGATLGIIAYTSRGYDVLRETLTATAMETYFKPMGCVGVKRYEVPDLHVLNFVLPEVLAGGGSRSLRIDAQGKAVGQVALEMLVEIPDKLIGKCGRNPQRR